jgi:hypothetical protein
MIAYNGRVVEHMLWPELFDLMPHFICSWLNMIWMNDSYLVALLVLGCEQE